MAARDYPLQSIQSPDVPAQLRGWTMFSGVLLMLAGFFGVINGVIALMNSSIYAVGENAIVLFDITQWGWIHLIVGGAVAGVGLVVMGTGALWARVLGVIVVMGQAIVQVAF